MLVLTEMNIQQCYCVSYTLEPLFVQSLTVSNVTCMKLTEGKRENYFYVFIKVKRHWRTCLHYTVEMRSRQSRMRRQRPHKPLVCTRIWWPSSPTVLSGRFPFCTGVITKYAVFLRGPMDSQNRSSPSAEKRVFLSTGWLDASASSDVQPTNKSAASPLESSAVLAGLQAFSTYQMRVVSSNRAGSATSGWTTARTMEGGLCPRTHTQSTDQTSLSIIYNKLTIIHGSGQVSRRSRFILIVDVGISTEHLISKKSLYVWTRSILALERYKSCCPRRHFD